ncbi:hypothetical protein [Streptacidiphilus cavernicola]|uniref:Uncharacterized protein n=1 Tax=Streptacidiphilus cavernicola TaxID=3342716 RepID=A0ABV6VUR0_9ACTN
MPSTAPTPGPAPLAAAGRCLEELDRALRTAFPGTDDADLDVRRVRTDLVHLRESLALLSAAAAGPVPGPRAMVDVPDTPYDPSMWRDADDEGIGCRHR